MKKNLVAKQPKNWRRIFYVRRYTDKLIYAICSDTYALGDAIEI